MEEELQLSEIVEEAPQVVDYVPDGVNYWVSRFRRPPVNTLVDEATIKTNASVGSDFRVTLGGNRTLGNPTNAYDRQIIIWEIIQDGTGNRTLTLDSKFVAGTFTITASTTTAKRDFLAVIYNQTTDKFYVQAFNKGY